jgi:DNA-binding MarR family transcriptional regulator
MSAEKHTRPLLALRALKFLLKGPTTHADLRREFGLSKSAAARLLAAMAEDGVEVTRTPSPADASYVFLSVSRAAALRALGIEQ